MPISMSDLLVDGIDSPQDSSVDPMVEKLFGNSEEATYHEGPGPNLTLSIPIQTTVSLNTNTERIDVGGTPPLRQAHDDAMILPGYLRGGTATKGTNAGVASVPITPGTESIDFPSHETDVEMTDANVEESQETSSAPQPETEGEEEPIRRDAHISANDSSTSSQNEGGSCMSGDEGGGRASGSLSHSIGDSQKKGIAEDVEGGAAVVLVAEEDSELNIRIDKATGNVCVIDTLRALDPPAFIGRKGCNALFQIKGKYSVLCEGATKMQLNGKDQAALTAQPLLLCEIAYLAMEDRPNNRRETLLKVMEFLSVDVAWIAKWEKKYSKDSGKSSSKKQANTQEEAAVDAQGEDSVEEQDEGEDSSSDDAPIRINGDVGSVTDMLRFIDPAQCPVSDRGGPWRKLSHAHPELKAKSVLTCFNGGSPVAGSSFASLVEMAWCWMSLQGYIAKDRRYEVRRLCKLLGVATSVLDKLEKANWQPASTTSDGKRKAAALESDQQGGSSTTRKTPRHSIDKNSASSSSSGGSQGSSVTASKEVDVPADFELRIDKKTTLGSVNDVINHVLSRHGGTKNPSTRKERDELAAVYPALCENFQELVCGRGGPTPLADAETLIRVAFLASGDVSKEHREYVAQQVCDAYGKPHSFATDVQKSLTNDRLEASAANKEPSEKRAAKEKRPRSFESSRPTDRVMKMRGSTAVSTTASRNALGTSAPSSPSMDISRPPVDSNENSHSRSSKGKGKAKEIVASDAPVDIYSGNNIGCEGAADSNAGGVSSTDTRRSGVRGSEMTIDNQGGDHSVGVAVAETSTMVNANPSRNPNTVRGSETVESSLSGSHSGGMEVAALSEGAGSSGNTGVERRAPDSNAGGGSSTSGVRGDETVGSSLGGNYSGASGDTGAAAASEGRGNTGTHGVAGADGGAGGGSSNMNIVQDGESGGATSNFSAESQARIKRLEESLKMVQMVTPGLERVEQSQMSAEMKQQINGFLLQSLLQHNGP